MNNTFFCSLFLLFLTACTSSLGVDDIFNNRNNLDGKSIEVEGILLNQGTMLKLCDKKLGDDCILLEYKKDLKNELSNNIGSRVQINGNFIEHEYVETDNGLTFVPSRLSILSIKLLRNHK